MSVGDLVECMHHLNGKIFRGLVLDIFEDSVQIFWNDGKIHWELMGELEVLSESR